MCAVPLFEHTSVRPRRSASALPPAAAHGSRPSLLDSAASREQIEPRAIGHALNDPDAREYVPWRILDKRGTGAGEEWLIQWQGYGRDAATWESANQFRNVLSSRLWIGSGLLAAAGSAGVADRSWLAGGCLPAVPMQRDRDADLRPATCVLSFFYILILFHYSYYSIFTQKVSAPINRPVGRRCASRVDSATVTRALRTVPSRPDAVVVFSRIPPRGEQVRRNEQGASGVDGFVWRVGRA
eukprot:COSAG01_NODE_8080_length_2929_cov_23.547350_1_plen_241_part_00